MWSFPYPFKTNKIEVITRIIQIIFSVTIIHKLYPETLKINGQIILTGILVGIALLTFHLVYNRGIKIRAHQVTKSFIVSHLFLFTVIIPAEEFLYRGIFFQVLFYLWGAKAGVLLSVALSTMIYVTIWRKPLYWMGAGLVSMFSALALYYTGSIWAPIILHTLNDFGITLVEGKNAFLKT